MGARRHDSDSGVAQLCKAGGSRMLIVPRGVAAKAGVEVGDRFRVWTPMYRVIMAERLDEMKGDDVWPVEMAEIVANIEWSRQVVRNGGKMEMRQLPAKCIMCGKEGLSVTFTELHMCLKCEGMVAAVKTVCYGPLRGGVKKVVI